MVGASRTDRVDVNRYAYNRQTACATLIMYFVG